MTSEIARLREQIEAECESLRMLRLFSSTASHELIRVKFDVLDKHYQQLIGVVGKTEAVAMCFTIYNAAMDKCVEDEMDCVGEERNGQREHPSDH